MSRNLLSLSVSTALLGSGALADVPSVAVDIAPIHSLVARVMSGVGEPDLIVPPGASPHDYQLRPSDAQALQSANLVFWIGEDLTPQLENAIETLASNASVTALLEAESTKLLDFREGALFEEHDHGDHDEHGDDDHDVDEHAKKHDDHGHDDHSEAEHDDHGHDDHAGHDHGEHDPHAWLSPQNAREWLNIIAGQLSAADPDNAGAYFTNAAAARDELSALTTEVSEILEPARSGRFIVFHDAYQYFENDFDFIASGAISLGDASKPSPARISEIQTLIRNEGIDCVLAEPQFNPGLVATVLDGTDASTRIVDPLGTTLEPGPDLYPQLIRNMAKTFADCL